MCEGFQRKEKTNAPDSQSTLKKGPLTLSTKKRRRPAHGLLNGGVRMGGLRGKEVVSIWEHHPTRPEACIAPSGVCLTVKQSQRGMGMFLGIVHEGFLQLRREEKGDLKNTLPRESGLDQG